MYSYQTGSIDVMSGCVINASWCLLLHCIIYKHKTYVNGLTKTFFVLTLQTTDKTNKAETTAMESPAVDIPDCEQDRRFSVLLYEQVRHLHELMNEVISIHGRGNFPTIEVKLCDLVSVVRKKLEEDGVRVKEIRLNGSGASSVLAADSVDISYNDLDLIFSVDLSTGKAYERVKCAVLESLMQLLPEGVSRKRMSSCSMKEAYVSKMVKVNDSDRWSLITLGNNRSKSVELKFVDTMRRQYEFSVDSFHILLDTLFLFYDCNTRMPISDNFYPTVVGESMYGDFNEALYHLHKKLIATKSPEEIRGGGLLKYCNLLCKGYQPAWPEQVKSMERYMCSRFFIDFPDIAQQQSKLENYLYNHFHSSEDRMKYEYLMILFQVVDESTVCLMGHERRLTLTLIEDLAYQVYNPENYSCCSSSYSSASSVSGGDHSDPNLLSPMSVASSETSSIDSGSGYTTPQKPDTPAPAPTTSSNTTLQQHNNNSTTTVITTTNAVVPHQHHHQAAAAAAPGPNPTTPTSLIPTYEIVTSCQPAVVYSNGYYYTSFNNSVSTSTTVTTISGPCLACSCNQMIATNSPPAAFQMS